RRVEVDLGHDGPLAAVGPDEARRLLIPTVAPRDALWPGRIRPLARRRPHERVLAAREAECRLAVGRGFRRGSGESGVSSDPRAIVRSSAKVSRTACRKCGTPHPTHTPAYPASGVAVWSTRCLAT